jgi:tetratricopeptide (TPR) repeat protein
LNKNKNKETRIKKQEKNKNHQRLFIVITAVIMPLMFLLLLELVLRISGFGFPSGFFVKTRIDGQQVYTQNPKFSLRFFPPELSRPACPMIIPARKSPRTIRIFVLGGSAAMGDPDYSYGFSRMLDEMLKQIPDTRFEVFNVAVTAINSHVVLPVARDCAKLDPDLFIVYLGNNEVIGPYGPGTVFTPFLSKLGLIRISIFVKSTRIGQLIDQISWRFGRHSSRMESWGGLNMFLHHRLGQDDPRLDAVYSNFKENLEELCNVGQKAGAKVIISTLVNNLKGCAPFGSAHRRPMTAQHENNWHNLYEKAINLESYHLYNEAVSTYLQALELDEAFAECQYRLARCYLVLGQPEAALNHFIRARDRDILRFRADTKINHIIRTIVSSTDSQNIRLLDAETAFRIPGPRIPGYGSFYDHVHFNITGNFKMALLLKKQVEEIFDINNRFKEMTEPECRRHLALTPWEMYRMQKEMFDRMKSPVFTGQLDHAQTLRSLQSQVDSLGSLLTHATLVKAVDCYQTAIGNDTEDWVLRNNFGLLLLEAVHDPVRAAEQFQHVLHLFPEDYLTLNNLGLAYAEQGDLNAAVNAFSRALAIKPEFSEAHFNLGEIFEKQSRFEEALSQYLQAQLSEKQLARVYDRVAVYMAGRNRIEQAATYFDTALTYWPDSPEIETNYGLALCNRGTFEQAVPHFKKALAIDPGFLEAYHYLAGAYSQLGRSQEAIIQLRKALRINPDNPHLHNNLGAELLKLGRIEQAITHFEAALRTAPALASARNNLNIARSRLKRIHREGDD